MGSERLASLALLHKGLHRSLSVFVVDVIDRISTFRHIIYMDCTALQFVKSLHVSFRLLPRLCSRVEIILEFFDFQVGLSWFLFSNVCKVTAKIYSFKSKRSLHHMLCPWKPMETSFRPALLPPSAKSRNRHWHRRITLSPILVYTQNYAANLWQTKAYSRWHILPLLPQCCLNRFFGWDPYSGILSLKL